MNEDDRIYFEETGSFLLNKNKNIAIQKVLKNTIGKSENELFSMAEQHMKNALSYRAPRLEDRNNHSSYFFHFQTSHLWQKFLLLLSYVFMYLVFLSFEEPKEIQKWAEWSFLAIFWIDVLLEIYHKNYETLRFVSRFQTRFYFKITLLFLLTLDQFILTWEKCQEMSIFRPFLVFRCCKYYLLYLGLPVLYHPALRKNIEAMKEIISDLLVYIFFYSLVIVIFAIFASQIIILDSDKEIDEYTEDYGNLGKDLFLMYCLSSYEGYPDNQIQSIKKDQTIQIFYISFIMLNMFFFVTIPTSLLFKSFKKSRSRIILIDELKQQNSLILAFVCLSKNDREINRDKLVKFLLFMFKNKPSYIPYITEVVLELDQNSSDKIEIGEFIQLCKIMQAHGKVDPPLFNDNVYWIQFRRYINRKLKVKKIVLGSKFNLAICIVILLSILNAILFLYTDNTEFKMIDSVVSYLYMFELIIKFIGIGPENYFRDPWNKRDFVVILFIFVLEVLSYQQYHWLRLFKESDINVMAKVFRFYRLTWSCKYFTETHRYISNNDTYIRISRLVTQIIITIPIVIEFFPLFLIVFYFFGIILVQIYSILTENVPEAESPYYKYTEVSNFKSFLYSQFFMIQTLVEGGWSVVGYDHAYRYQESMPFALTMLIFVITHFSITLVLNSLVKGVIWEIYQQVSEELDRKMHENIINQKKENEISLKKNLLNEIKNKIHLNKLLTLENLISREIYENKVDNQIRKKMKEALNTKNNNYLRKKEFKTRSSYIPTLLRELKLLNVDEIDVLENEESK